MHLVIILSLLAALSWFMGVSDPSQIQEDLIFYSFALVLFSTPSLYASYEEGRRTRVRVKIKKNNKPKRKKKVKRK